MSKPTYDELLSMLDKIVNRATRPIHADSTGQAMVQLRSTLIEQAREMVENANLPSDEQFLAALGPCGK